MRTSLTVIPPSSFSRLTKYEESTMAWDSASIHSLRKHISASQAALAEIIGVRQQTISEWERGVYKPKKSMCKYLMLIAERYNFNREVIP